MSFLLTCPNCGPRDVSEFRYGGEVLQGMPANPGAPPVNLPGSPGSNLPGRQQERWYHRHGCRRWLRAERDVRTNEVFHTEWLDGDAP
jgi:sarcosine oxidase subunit delta